MAAAEEMIVSEEPSRKGRTISKNARQGSRHDEHEMLNVVIQNDVSLCLSDRDTDWLRKIMDQKDQFEKPQPNKAKIQKVPQMLRQIKSSKRCFDPIVVSIGPYHHGKPELEAVEKLKIIMTHQYVKKYAEISIEELYIKVAAVTSDARKCYAEGSTENFDDEKFSRMMFLDGCFILQFIHCFVYSHDDMKMKSNVAAFVQRDLFLLENQLPFKILEVLMSSGFKNDEGKRMINDFIEHIRALPPQQDSYKDKIMKFVQKYVSVAAQDQRKSKNDQIEEPPVHLLALLHSQLVDNPTPRGTHSDWNSYRSAKELKMVGIHFRPSSTHLLTDVQFIPTLLSGQLTLPPITIDDSTESRLLNLVAYETCPDAPDDFGVTSYLCFLDSLIDHAEDVKELRSKGILLNMLGSDQQAADLFNEIANDLVPNPSAYGNVKWQIDRHYKNMIKIWIAEWLHVHFSSPWTFIAFVAATFAIILSVIQTYLAVFPKDGDSKPCHPCTSTLH